MWGGRLRKRGPRRTDPALTKIHDALCDDVLRYIAILHAVRSPRYVTRARARARSRDSTAGAIDSR